MTIRNVSRSGLSHSLIQVGVGLISAGLMFLFGVVAQQQLSPQELTTKSPLEAKDTPTGPTLPPISKEDFKSDPLFLEIQKIVQAGGIASVGSVPKNNSAESISNSRWYAVESILTASRTLEQDVAECIQRSDIEGAARLQRSIQNLRAQALQLLQ